MELYDLTRDPWEQVDLARNLECADVRNELARCLYQHMVETDDPRVRGAVTSPRPETTLKILQGKSSPIDVGGHDRPRPKTMPVEPMRGSSGQLVPL